MNLRSSAAAKRGTWKRHLRPTLWPKLTLGQCTSSHQRRPSTATYILQEVAAVGVHSQHDILTGRVRKNRITGITLPNYPGEATWVVAHSMMKHAARTWQALSMSGYLVRFECMVGAMSVPVAQ